MSSLLALDRFTVRDLARASGVKLATIRTQLNRYPDFVIPDPGQSSERPRGGQFRMYRINPERKAALRQELEQLYSLLPNAEASPEAPFPTGDAETPRVALEAFEELLDSCLEITDEPTLTRLQQRAGAARKAAKQEVQSLVAVRQAESGLERRLHNAELALRSMERNWQPQPVAQAPAVETRKPVERVPATQMGEIPDFLQKVANVIQLLPVTLQSQIIEVEQRPNGALITRVSPAKSASRASQTDPFPVLIYHAAGSRSPSMYGHCQAPASLTGASIEIARRADGTLVARVALASGALASEEGLFGYESHSISQEYPFYPKSGFGRIAHKPDPFHSKSVSGIRWIPIKLAE